MRFFMAAMLLLISFSAAHADKFSCEKWERKYKEIPLPKFLKEVKSKSFHLVFREKEDFQIYDQHGDW